MIEANDQIRQRFFDIQDDCFVDGNRSFGVLNSPVKSGVQNFNILPQPWPYHLEPDFLAYNKKRVGNIFRFGGSVEGLNLKLEYLNLRAGVSNFFRPALNDEEVEAFLNISERFEICTYPHPHDEKGPKSYWNLTEDHHLRNSTAHIQEEEWSNGKTKSPGLIISLNLAFVEAFKKAPWAFPTGPNLTMTDSVQDFIRESLAHELIHGLIRVLTNSWNREEHELFEEEIENYARAIVHGKARPSTANLNNFISEINNRMMVQYQS